MGLLLEGNVISIHSEYSSRLPFVYNWRKAFMHFYIWFNYTSTQSQNLLIQKHRWNVFYLPNETKTKSYPTCQKIIHDVNVNMARWRWQSCVWDLWDVFVHSQSRLLALYLQDQSGSIHLGKVQCSSSMWTAQETVPTIHEIPKVWSSFQDLILCFNPIYH